MGNTHSAPRIDREGTKRPIMGRRKLSKPRVGNHSSRGDLSIPCLPPAPVIIGGRVSKPTNGTTQRINRAIPRQLVVSEVPGISSPEDGIVPLNCGSTRSRRHSLSHQQLPSVSHSRNPSLTGSYQDYPLPLPKYNSSRNTAFYNDDKTSGLDRSHPPLSVMRRRSLIAAAPPATKTRRQPTLILEGGMPAPPLLALNLAEANKVQTPSGYSVLGGFKRGSLRIVNTSASPAPSPQDLFPKRRNTSPTHPKTPSCSVLMVAPTPQITLESHENEGYFGYHGTLPVSGGQETDTPLSFRTAPEGIFCSNDEFKKTPTPGLARSSNHELDSSKLSGTTGEPKDMPIVRNASSNSNLHFNFSGTRDTIWHAYKKPAPRPSVKSSTDSGYCSTGSIRSLASCSVKASDGDLQHGSETTNIVSARLDSPFNSPQEPPPMENSNDASRTIMEVAEYGGFSKYIDKYPQTAVTEGSIIEHMLPSRTRKLSLSSGGHVFCS